MSRRFVLAFDQGTTSSRTVVLDADATVCDSASLEFPQIYPHPGWVEHDAETIWLDSLELLKELLVKAKIKTSSVDALGITNQRETTVVWDRATGRPIHNAIVWQCRRTVDACQRLLDEGLGETIQDRTGLVVDAYFSGTKLQWILDHVPRARQRAARGELCFGTIDSWLLYKLTGLHATDFSNASRTMLFNINSLAWDDTLLDAMAVPREILPSVAPSSQIYGVTRAFGAEIPVAALCGDQQSALFGQTGFSPHDCKNTYGTGCFALMNTGAEVAKSRHGLISTIAWGLDGRVEYALEGSVFIGGAVIQWLRDELGLLQSAAESEGVAAQVPDTGGVYIVPAFSGLGAPHWDMQARGTVTGLTRGSNRAHLVRAALESIAYQSADVLDSMRADSGAEIPQLRVDGGAAANNLLMQHQADVLGIPVVRGKVIETTALGAAFLAGLGVGLWGCADDLRGVWREDRVFEPRWDDSLRAERLDGWRRAVAMTSPQSAG